MENAKNQQAFKNLILNPVKYKLFLLSRLPMALLAGLKIVHLTNQKSQVSIPFKYLTQNPFKSIYFACLAMAAELAQGVMIMMHSYKSSPPISTLPIKMEAEFVKKATGKIVFECLDGERFETAIAESFKTGEARQVKAASIGRDKSGEQVAVFYFTWSFKVKTNRKST